MSRKRDDFDAIYRRASDYFGNRPEEILPAHVEDIDRQRPAIDIGAGQGRNAASLAERGIRVDAIDPSAEAIAAVERLAKTRNLPIRATATGFEAFDPGTGFDSYSAICLFGIVQILTRQAIGSLCDRVSAWSAAGSLVFMTAFTTDDPGYKTCLKSWYKIDKNCFAGESGAVRTYLDPGEATSLFPEFGVVHHWEGLGPEHRHGEGPIRRHGLVEVVFKR